jgi:DNA helicase HerA-like ATPase
VFELPDLSNTSFILEFTQMFLEGVFIYAKQNPGNKYCIVLEEAHTIIPESSFLGDLGDYGSNKGLVSKMGQIALQGRKYGVGFIVIAQRTANVSKTVLTQCNTVICFQAFDETSFTFLGNYVGKDMVQALPNLKQYHAIIAGKAVKSNMPMIVDLKR